MNLKNPNRKRCIYLLCEVWTGVTALHSLCRSTFICILFPCSSNNNNRVERSTNARGLHGLHIVCIRFKKRKKKRQRINEKNNNNYNLFIPPCIWKFPIIPHSCRMRNLSYTYIHHILRSLYGKHIGRTPIIVLCNRFRQSWRAKSFPTSWSVANWVFH